MALRRHGLSMRETARDLQAAATTAGMPSLGSVTVTSYALGPPTSARWRTLAVSTRKLACCGPGSVHALARRILPATAMTHIAIQEGLNRAGHRQHRRPDARKVASGGDRLLHEPVRIGDCLRSAHGGPTTPREMAI